MTYIVAEVGSNWENQDDLKDSISMAKSCGADAVKFQLFSAYELYGVGDYAKMPGELPKDWLPKLAEKAQSLKIDFMCTPFSVSGVDFVDPFVKTHKVASAELTHKRMLQRLNEKGKAVFLSTGGAGEAEISYALSLLKNVPVTILYCVAAYPAKSVRLENIQDLKKKFDRPVGFSDHSTDYFTIPKTAVEKGAVVLEKHFKLRDMNTPDSPHSLNPTEFKMMVDYVRGKEFPRQGHDETEMVTHYRRRLKYISSVRKGETLTEGVNFDCVRSLETDVHAVHGFQIDDVNGKMATRDAGLQDPVKPGDWV